MQEEPHRQDRLAIGTPRTRMTATQEVARLEKAIDPCSCTDALNHFLCLLRGQARGDGLQHPFRHLLMIPMAGLRAQF